MGAGRRPTTVGNTACGESSPANPARIIDEPASNTSVAMAEHRASAALTIRVECTSFNFAGCLLGVEASLAYCDQTSIRFGCHCSLNEQWLFWSGQVERRRIESSREAAAREEGRGSNRGGP